jgi:hypothetical protein
MFFDQADLSDLFGDLRSYLMDPYAMMMHYKRAFKLLSVMKQHSAKVLILGRGEKTGLVGVHRVFLVCLKVAYDICDICACICSTLWLCQNSY